MGVYWEEGAGNISHGKSNHICRDVFWILEALTKSFNDWSRAIEGDQDVHSSLELGLRNLRNLNTALHRVAEAKRGRAPVPKELGNVQQNGYVLRGLSSDREGEPSPSRNTTGAVSIHSPCLGHARNRLGGTTWVSWMICSKEPSKPFSLPTFGSNCRVGILVCLLSTNRGFLASNGHGHLQLPCRSDSR